MALSLGLGGVAIGVIVKAYSSYVLKNLYPFGYKIGKFISSGLRKSLGISKAEKLEADIIETTLEELTKGLKAGLDYDDSRKDEG
jgi:uncharacterized protein YebE (UPF0316 family)